MVKLIEKEITKYLEKGEEEKVNKIFQKKIYEMLGKNKFKVKKYVSTKKYKSGYDYRIKVQCLKCKKIYETSLKSLCYLTRKCRLCESITDKKGIKLLKTEDRLEKKLSELKENGYDFEILKTPSNYRDTIIFRCKECGKVYEITFNTFARDRNKYCVNCNKIKKIEKLKKKRVTSILKNNDKIENVLEIGNTLHSKVKVLMKDGKTKEYTVVTLLKKKSK